MRVGFLFLSARSAGLARQVGIEVEIVAEKMRCVLPTLEGMRMQLCIWVDYIGVN